MSGIFPSHLGGASIAPLLRTFHGRVFGQGFSLTSIGTAILCLISPNCPHSATDRVFSPSGIHSTPRCMYAYFSPTSPPLQVGAHRDQRVIDFRRFWHLRGRVLPVGMLKHYFAVQYTESKEREHVTRSPCWRRRTFWSAARRA